MNSKANALWHVVLVSFRAEIPEKARQDIYSCYQTLAERCGGKKAGILFWRVDWNLDTRKAVHLVEIAVFDSDRAFEAFRSHPEHTAITNMLRDIADWTVGDIHFPYAV